MSFAFDDNSQALQTISTLGKGLRSHEAYPFLGFSPHPTSTFIEPVSVLLSCHLGAEDLSHGIQVWIDVGVSVGNRPFLMVSKQELLDEGLMLAVIDRA